MRLLTWNCGSGAIDRRLDDLRPLHADVIALQNCASPSAPAGGVLWRGPLDGGVAVVPNNPALKVEPVAVPSDLPETVLPVLVRAPEPFILIDLWARRQPTSEAFALEAVSMCAVGISLPMVVIGDFDSTPIVESQRRTSRELMRRLHDEFGLISAYHAHHGADHGREPHPTFFMNRQENRPFHIDYCFVPEAWRERIVSVDVGSLAEFTASDHQPMVVELSF